MNHEVIISFIFYYILYSYHKKFTDVVIDIKQ